MDVEGLVEELAERIRAIFKRNSVEGCITGPLSDGHRYIVLSYDDYAAHLQNRQARGRKEAAEALSRHKAAGEVMAGILEHYYNHEYNPFEPDNQTPQFNRIADALTAWNSIGGDRDT